MAKKTGEQLQVELKKLGVTLTGEETYKELTALLADAVSDDESDEEETEQASAFNCANCEDSGKECIECGAGR